MLDPRARVTGTATASESPAEVELEIVNQYGANALMLKLGTSCVLLDPAEIDELIETLGLARVDLEPAVPAEVPRGHQFPLETEPRWKTIVDPAFAGVVLFLRHSGLGWTGFAIPLASAHRLLEIGQRRVVFPVSQSVN
ncbi:hypothetical protein [Paraburkholderia sp. J12]|uniref:hypothetical protein n=1 Tax=Paraburkholderia sp. J12 TaxID=2805432 RepID=UPI002ABDB9BD|nr:hypothetical protein [Paraburkholderia sp. J12]